MNAGPRSWLLAGLLVPVLLGARSAAAPDVESLLRAGNAAFDRGAYAEAIVLYEKAGDRTTDPGLAAFNLAAAKYQLARGGNAQALADAELAYRCCLERGDPRRARALFGLGNCLLLRAGGASLDGVALRSAIDRFGECLRDPGCDKNLAADARYNRQRARLLLLQAPPSPEGAANDSSDDDPKEDPTDPPKGPDEKRQPGASDEGSDKGAKPAPDKGDAERSGGDKHGTTAPGRGVLPPVRDSAEPAPIGPQDAQEHLEQATRRILEEMRQYRRGKPRSAGPGVRDW
jgi:tetratricopeptide (TPR) repeat protein